MTTNWNALTAGGKPVLTVSPGPTSTTGADYGSDTSGTTTNGIQEAINKLQGASTFVGGVVMLLPGQFAVKSQITVTKNNIRIVGGAGGYNYTNPSTEGAVLYDARTGTGGGALLLVGPSSGSLQGFELEGLQIASALNNQSISGSGAQGALQFQNSHFCRLTGFSINGGNYNYALGVSDSDSFFIREFRVIDAANAIIYLFESHDLFIEHGFISADTGSPIGLQIQDCPNGPINISDLDITGGGSGSTMYMSECIYINANGDDCNFIFIDRVLCDRFADDGVYITGLSGHACLSVRFHECYMSSGAGHGVNINADVSDLTFVDCVVAENGLTGFWLEPMNPRPNGILLLGNTIAHNGISNTTGKNQGVVIDADTFYRIESNFIGDDDIYTGSYTQAYGINASVAPGSSTYWIVTGNILMNNTAGAVENSTNFTANVIYSNNWPNTP